MLIEAIRHALKLKIRPKLAQRVSSGGCGNCNDNDDQKPLFIKPSSGNSDNPGAPTIYDCRKLGHRLPTNDVNPCFKILKGFPTGVFRNTAGETLGVRGAAKCCCYQNPEYFSYHHMSFYDMNLYMAQYKRIVRPTGRKRDII